MAERFLFNITEGILKSLGSLAAEETGLLWGVEDELGKLKSTVLTIKAVLLVAEEKQDVNPAVKVWLENLNDILYDADDLLDAVSTEVLRRERMTRDKKAKKVRIFFSKSNQLAFGFKLAHKIKSIRERLDAVKAERGFLLEERHEERQMRHRARDDTDSVVPAEEIIGRENDKEAIIRRLIDSNGDETISIHAIVGLGGLGKTTLAQLIFNDEKVQKHFEVKMWVCVGDDFDVKIIVEKMLESVRNQKEANIEMNTMNTMANYLRKKFDGMKYLLILDDVWNEDEEKWSNLKKLLVGGTRDSKILIATGIDKVAKIMHSNPYYLQGLNEQESWNLFKQMAFEDGNGPRSSRVEGMGKEIIKRCVGVPLAVKMMGRLLYFKNPESEWQNFINNELLELPQNENDILPTLKLSYNKLPSYLKPCFAYCSLFPKNYFFDKTRLINLWIAQGFVRSSSKNQSLEHSGHEYFLDLFWRSFFQEVKRPNDVIHYKMHDLMHDLAILVAGSLTITISDNNKRYVNEKARHIAIGKDIKFFSTIQTSLHQANKIRTFLCPTISYEKVEIDCEALFSSFKSLRTLDLSGSNFKYLSSFINELKHLRYLDISYNNNIVELPNSLTTLVNLHTLKLIYCHSLEKLPRDIKNLVNLRHLENGGCLKLRYMPYGLKQLTNLQRLAQFMVHSSSLSKHSASINELSKLNNLRGGLEIRGLSHAKGVASEYKAVNLKEKASLGSLCLYWTTRGDVNDFDAIDDEMSLEGFRPHPNLKDLHIFDYWGSRISTWLLSVTGLVNLGLRHCKKCQYLPPLSQLPSLKNVWINHMDALQYISDYGYENECSSNSSVPATFFPSLKRLCLTNCPNLKGWWRSDYSVGVDKDNDNSVETTIVASTTGNRLLPSFPHLSKLFIEGCPMLTLMPMFLRLEDLCFKNGNWKLVQQIMTMDTSTATASSTLSPSSSTPLSKLKGLSISSTPELETLPEEWLQNLTSLEGLWIAQCDKLQSLFPGLQHATTLQHLELRNCPKLEFASDKDVMQWQRLKSLLSLRFYGLTKLVSLPIVLQHLTNLKYLEILYCESLTTIPEWICSYKSLQLLKIVGCSCLTSLPEGMRELSSLRVLEIVKCPILTQRCEKEIGEDWPKIAKLPILKLVLAQESNSLSDEETMVKETSEEVETPKRRGLKFRGLFKDLGLNSFCN